MISQLKSTLEQNAKFEKRNVETPLAETSLKDRLKSLNDSANSWQQRVSPRPLSNSSTPLRRPISTILSNSSLILKQRPLSTQLHQSTPLFTPTIRDKPCDITTGLNKFFSATPAPRTTTTHKSYDTTESVDLDAISVTTTPILKMPTRVRAPNRKKGRSTNIDERIIQEKIELNEADFAEIETEPEKLETQQEAIDALTKTRNLLKTPTGKSTYPDVMLIQVRGSKWMDVRLVAPVLSSIHENACFIVVTRDQLLKYEGANTNILEKTKATQICIDIIGKTDLNCAAEKTTEIKGNPEDSMLTSVLTTCENESPEDSKINMDEMESLSEAYEIKAARINLVFRITDEHSLQTCSRREKLSIQLLQPNESLIFDFGTEIYVWSGRSASKLNSAYALEYGKRLLNKRVSNVASQSADTSDDTKRPDWTLFRKIFQGVQNTLFKAKFYDWTEKETMTTCRPSSRISPISLSEPKRRHVEDEVETLVRRLLEEEPVLPKMLLEDQEVLRDMRDIITEDLSLWHLKGENLEQITFTSRFLSDKCYVVRWQYRVQKSGVRRIETGTEEERETGRSRIAFFYWLGQRTTSKQQGMCALRIKDIDRDNSPRVRVVQNNEPALFLTLFQESFVVLHDEEARSRQFVVLGGTLSETSLCEVSDDAPLRSHAVYVTCAPREQMNICCGTDCSREHVKFALTHAEKLDPSSDPSVEVEGDVKGQNWISSKGRRRAIRAWRLFENDAEQLIHLHDHDVCSFTYSQQVLCDTVLIDVGGAMWLWSEQTVSTFALRVADRYWRDRKGDATVVHEGWEPVSFKGLFMEWEDKVMTDEEMAVQTPKPARDLKELLKERCRHFTIEELRNRTNLPEGMDTRQLEEYLTEPDFFDAFKMNRNDFYSMQSWKQNEARKKAGIF